jgi:hypothetical protein
VQPPVTVQEDTAGADDDGRRGDVCQRRVAVEGTVEGAESFQGRHP